MWSDAHTLLLATKCNRLLRVDMSRSSHNANRRVLDIPLPQRSTDARPRLHLAPASAGEAAPVFRRLPPFAIPGRWSLGPSAAPPPPLRAQSESCGIHALERSPLGTRVAVGAANPCDVAILHADALDRHALCCGHADWVFAVAWIDEDVLVSGGRDTVLKVWDARRAAKSALRCCRGSADSSITSAAATRAAHPSKVRAMCYLSAAQRLATMSVDGKLKLWDPAGGLTPSGEFVALPPALEHNCLASSPGSHLCAIGSLSRVTLLDVRTRGVPASLEAPDSGAGIRSLSLRGYLVTVGAADGTLSFIDQRMMRFTNSQLSIRGGRFYSPLDEAARDAAEFDLALSMAVFCHAWDEGGTRLAVAGGPLLSGTRGCYAGVWS